MKLSGKCFEGTIISVMAGFFLILGGCNSGGYGDLIPKIPGVESIVQGGLKVSNAPANVNGKFVAAGQVGTQVQGNTAAISWTEPITGRHSEILIVSQDTVTGEVGAVFQVQGATGNGSWFCGTKKIPGNRSCQGLTVDRAAGTAVFVNTVLEFSAQSITLNGVLSFPAF